MHIPMISCNLLQHYVVKQNEEEAIRRGVSPAAQASGQAEDGAGEGGSPCDRVLLGQRKLVQWHDHGREQGPDIHGAH